jgi:5-methylcytosine-specific restriction endonuclease McrA
MAAHPEKCREAVRKCRDIHREKQREAVRKHRAEHLQEERELERKYYVARHDLMLAKQRKFRSTERGRAGKCAAEHNRRLRKGNIRLTTGILLELKADRHGICPYCGEQIIEGHFDHVIPLVKGGTNARENILWVCATCNRKKKDKGLVEFLMDRNGEQAAMIEDGTALQLVEAALGLERR